MTLSYEYIPAYVSPLTDKEHAQIGRIAILWGQIESSVDELLTLATPFDDETLTSINILEKNVGGKVTFLKAVNKRQTDRSVKSKIDDFFRIIDETKVQRNHVFHGVWGWRGNSRTKNVEPCARNSKHPAKPLKIKDLETLEKQLCKASRLGFNLVCQLRNWDGSNVLGKRIYFSERACPEWLEQWSEHNSLNDGYLDRNAKEGQLPRLTRLLPHK